ncbi:ROK family protein [Actinotalea sp. K2]|uniref:ROK family protein n=1 Tax=Actinotalea sp. K2 TaxID=2939438 RepID=UPI002016D2C3|nr:ROK family protein [Actinotalea sp. K2]MCL3860384.1 ROK family protein [Actinotalea sp. K2]
MAAVLSGEPGRPGWSVGLDVGGTKVLGVLLDADAVVRQTVRVPTRRGVDGVVSCAEQAVLALCSAQGLAPGDLNGVGVGVPGLVDPSTGGVSHAVNLDIPGSDVPLGPLLAARLGGVGVDVENDLNVAALGAARVLGVTSGDLAFLALGTGVAAGLLLDGTLRRGHVGAAGEIGHVPYAATGPVCPCGQRGCLELYASGSAIDAAWPSRTGRPAPAEVFEAAASGDPQACAIRDAFVQAVATAVRLLVLTCDVEHVVLGGGVSEIGQPLLAAVSGAVRSQASGSPFLATLRIAERVQIVPSGALVAPIGAALAVRILPEPLTEGVSSWRS